MFRLSQSSQNNFLIVWIDAFQRHSDSGTCRFLSYLFLYEIIPSIKKKRIKGNILVLDDVILHTSGPAMSSGPQTHPVCAIGVETRDLGRDLGAGWGADSTRSAPPSSDPSLNWGLDVPLWRSNWLILLARANASSTVSFWRLPAGILWVFARSLIFENRSKKSIDSSLIVLLKIQKKSTIIYLIMKITWRKSSMLPEYTQIYTVWTKHKPGEWKERKRFVIVIGLVDKPSGTAIGFLIATDAEFVESMPTVAQVLEWIVEPSGSRMITHSITTTTAQQK